MEVPRVLVVTDSVQVQTVFRRLHEQGSWSIEISATLADAIHRITTEHFPLAVCDREIPDHEWRQVLKMLSTLSPDTCLLLASRVNDGFLWKEVIKFGGYDLLTKPLDALTVNRTLQKALHYHRLGPPAGGVR